MRLLSKVTASVACCLCLLLAELACPSDASSLLGGTRRALRQLADAAVTAINPAHLRSQVKQDEWVLTNHPSPGFFLDMGFEGRKCKLAEEVISNKTGDVVSFVMPNKTNVYGQGYGGIKDTISWSFILDYNGTTFANVTTLGLKDFLVKYDVPKHIDYWSLDIEGAEWWILKEFPFCDIFVGMLTVEHNWQEPRRTQMRDLLEHHGFVNERQVEYDDWYRNTNPPPGATARLESAPQVITPVAATSSLAACGVPPGLVTFAKCIAFGLVGAAVLSMVQWVIAARRGGKRARL